MPARPILLVLLVLLAACTDSPSTAPADTTDAADTAPDIVADTVDDTDTATDALVDTPEDTPDALEDPLADTPSADVVEDTYPSADVRPPDPDGCNLRQALCDRTYDQVAYATSHNAFSNEEEGWIAPNQLVPMPHQLADGVRGLMLDFHDDEGVASLCHGTCLAGRKPLADGLGEITTFLLANPREVVTLILEVYIEPEDVREAFEVSGLLDLVYTHEPARPWPTLQAMIDANTRVVVFTDRDGGFYPWYHDVWDFAVETPFSVAHPEDFACVPNRGRRGADLFILNHFISDPFPRPRYAAVVNLDPFLIDRARACQQAFGHLPNFVTVDFSSIGDVLEAVDRLNGVE